MTSTISRARLALVALGAVAASSLVGTVRAEATATQATQVAKASQAKAGVLSPTLATLATPTVQASSLAAQDQAVGLPADGPSSLQRTADGDLHVEVRMATFGAGARSTLAAAGATVISSYELTRTYTVTIDPTHLQELATAPGVEYASEVLQPLVGDAASTRIAARAAATVARTALMATCPTGVTDEGDAQLAANTARTTYGVDGSGVRVGVLSDSYNNLGTAATDVSNGDLPGATNPCGHTTPVTVQADLASGGTDEGRGMAQIVHDLAPGSPITFATAFNSESDFANQIRNLATNGSKVIVDDISYFDEPVYQDGIVAKAVNDVVAQGVSYFSSAANSNVIIGGNNVASYEAPVFRSATCPSSVSSLGLTDCHDFDTTAGVDTGDGITVPNNGTVRIKLGWNQPEYGITTDLDIALVDTTTGTVVAKSLNNNPTSGKAYEYVTYKNANGAARSYDIVVGRYGSGPLPRFKVIHINSSLSAVQYNASTGGDVVGPTTYGHNNGSQTISVAAVPYSNSNTVESYSSRGPSTYCWNPVNGTTAAAALPSCTTKNVDVAATDGAATSFFGSLVSGVYRFYGTSAAAPHAAAVAALQRQARPCRTAAEVLAAQKASGRAIGSFGVDAMGSGLIHAGNAIANLAACGSAPGAPTGATATRGNAQATVSWTAPASDGGSAITGYRITPYIGATAQAPQDFTSTATTQTITGLTNGTTYSFKVAATNALGTGADSSASNTVTPATTPGAPTDVTATRGNAQATVTWIGPASDGGSPITGYVVTPSIGGIDQAPQTFTSTATTQTITGLANGTAYAFTVAAVNAVGTGPGASSSADTTPATNPDAPTGATAVSLDGAALVSWSAPGNDGGSPITGYVVTPHVGATALTPITFGSTGTSQTLSGLTNGIAYTFTVQALNDVGPSSDSTPTGAVTPIGPASAPGTPTALPLSASAKVSWTAPSDANGSALAGYLITPYVGAVAQPQMLVGPATTTQTVTGLVNGTTYTFTVTAVTAYGPGVESGLSLPVTAGAPAAPAVANAPTPGNGTAKVTWSAAANNGSSVTGYVVTPYVGATALPPTTFASTATTQTITGLTNGTTYTFKVAGVNARGLGAQGTSPSVVVGVPSGPAFPSVLPGNGTAKVSWWAATANGAPVQGYVVTPYIGTTPQPPRTFASTATSQTITGLTNGTTYTFKIAAYNVYGTGAAATSYPQVVGVPLAPGVTQPTPGTGSAKVVWSAATANGSAVTGYVVTPYIGTAAQPAIAFASTATTQTITGLTNGTTYTFRVAATNSFGNGPQATTPAVTVGAPSGPAFPSAKPGDGTAALSWWASVANAAPVLGYIVTPYIGSTAQPAITFNSAANAQTITGLTNGTTYTFKIAAFNSFGTGPAATSATVVVGSPLAPTSVSAVAGAGQATVSWKAPASNGSAITAYKVTPYKGATALPTITFPSTATTQVVTGLTSGTAYTFKVVAVNARGPGPLSSASAPITPT